MTGRRIVVVRRKPITPIVNPLALFAIPGIENTRDITRVMFAIDSVIRITPEGYDTSRRTSCLVIFGLNIVMQFFAEIEKLILQGYRFIELQIFYDLIVIPGKIFM